MGSNLKLIVPPTMGAVLLNLITAPPVTKLRRSAQLHIYIIFFSDFPVICLVK